MILPALHALFAALALALAPPLAATQDPAANVAPPPAVRLHVAAGTGDVASAAVEAVRALAAQQLAELQPLFPTAAKHPFFVFVHASRADLPPELESLLHEDAPAMTLLGRRQVHLVWGEMRRMGANLRGVVRHELVHELLDQFAGPHGGRLPRWFHEGLAQYIAGDTYLGAREQDLVWRVGTRRLFSFGDLREGFPDDPPQTQIAYAQSYSYVSWLAHEFGVPALLDVAAATDGLTSFERALAGRTGRSTLQLVDAWRDHLLHGSGASASALLDQCFSYAMILALPVLAMALIRRLAAERRAAERLARGAAFDPEAERTGPGG